MDHKKEFRVLRLSASSINQLVALATTTYGLFTMVLISLNTLTAKDFFFDSKITELFHIQNTDI